MNIAGVVILYYPDQQVIENILSYHSFLGTIYIADNSPKASPEIRTAIAQRIPGSIYMHDGNNDGIAKRLNQVAAMAMEAGYDYLLTMDQDSSFEAPILENYFRCFNTFPGADTVAMFGVQYENPHWASIDCNAVPWTQLITSGSLVNLALWQQLSGFDEQLFIDTVDFEYCYRALINGYQVILFKNILLNHNLGTSQFSAADLQPRHTGPALHSPVRLYYMLRNHLYLKGKYKQHFPTEMQQSQQAILNRIKNNLLHNQQKLSVLRYVIKAVTDFRRKKMGSL